MSCCDGGMWCDILGSTGIVLVEYWWLMVLCHAGLKTGSPIWITGLPIWINGTCMTVIIDWSHNWSAWKQTEARRAPSPEGLQVCWYICGVARTVVTVTTKRVRIMSLKWHSVFAPIYFRVNRGRHGEAYVLRTLVFFSAAPPGSHWGVSFFLSIYKINLRGVI